MKGIEGYSKPSADGKGVIIDTESMMRDLIAVSKVGGLKKLDLLATITKMWHEVDVHITIPKEEKQ